MVKHILDMLSGKKGELKDSLVVIMSTKGRISTAQYFKGNIIIKE